MSAPLRACLSQRYASASGDQSAPVFPLASGRVPLVVPDAASHTELVATFVEAARYDAPLGTSRNAHAAALPYLPPSRVSRT
jgi:hypothetical protein